MHSVFITGGAGFLGAHLMRRLSADDPNRTFTVYSRDEAKHAKARSEFPQARFILGDVRDLDRLQLAMAGHDTVIHCAALKYVPEAERNVEQAIAVNVDGSRNVAQAAILSGVERVVGISTDKACEPINVYGMTKLLMERVFQEADGLSETQFNLVRYGNVIASTGSVIPIFVKQILETNSVTLTDGSMTRFWLTIEHAVELVTDALSESSGGTILIPRLDSMRMDGLVTAVAMALGKGGPGLDAPKLMDMGNRGGEKIHESLLSKHEARAVESVNPELMRLYPLTSSDALLERLPNWLSGAYSSDSSDMHFTCAAMAAEIARILSEMGVMS